MHLRRHRIQIPKQVKNRQKVTMITKTTPIVLISDADERSPVCSSLTWNVGIIVGTSYCACRVILFAATSRYES